MSGRVIPITAETRPGERVFIGTVQIDPEGRIAGLFTDRHVLRLLRDGDMVRVIRLHADFEFTPATPGKPGQDINDS